MPRLSPPSRILPIKCQSSMSTAHQESPAPNAALLIIGNEVLSGSITDANTPWLAKLLYSKGVDLVRVEVVPDEPDDIAATVLRLQQRVGPQGFVFTSGGIGPTHDDVTYESIAAALQLTIETHAPTVALMQQHYAARGIELNEARLRMAQLPTPSEVLFSNGIWVPLVVAGGNVFILPGIPRLFQTMVTAQSHRFAGPQTFSVDVFVDCGEGEVAAPVAEVAAAFPQVRIGSYPNTEFDMDKPDEKTVYRVKLTAEGRDEEKVKEAAEAMASKIREMFPNSIL